MLTPFIKGEISNSIMVPKLDLHFRKPGYKSSNSLKTLYDLYSQDKVDIFLSGEQFLLYFFKYKGEIQWFGISQLRWRWRVRSDLLTVLFFSPLIESFQNCCMADWTNLTMDALNIFLFEFRDFHIFSQDGYSRLPSHKQCAEGK